MNHSHSKSSMFHSSPSSDDPTLKRAVEASLLDAKVVPSGTTEPQEIETVKPSSTQTEGETPRKRKRNRCFSCKKRAGPIGFECKCGEIFCSGCRYPERHKCHTLATKQYVVLEKVVAPKLDYI
jgi:hypothetical protein